MLTGAGSGTKSELPSSSKMESTIESSMVTELLVNLGEDELTGRSRRRKKGATSDKKGWLVNGKRKQERGEHSSTARELKKEGWKGRGGWRRSHKQTEAASQSAARTMVVPEPKEEIPQQTNAIR